MDVAILARLQFAMTIGFHFVFPSISLGLVWLLVILEWRAWRRGDADYEWAAKFFGRLFALTFIVGVATGITMEFQFGTNWAEYSKFVGDIFGAPLAAEGVFAFFLESSFLGLYLFGRGRVSKGFHWFSVFMVAFGATLSAFWIIVANSWQQTPAGYRIVETATGKRAELTDFFAAIFNDSTLVRYTHTVDAMLVTGALFMAGIAAWLLLNGRHTEAAKKALHVAVVFGFVASVLALAPTGHESAKQVAHTQPEKFAAIEAHYEGKSQAAMVLLPYPEYGPPLRWGSVDFFEIPGTMSWLAFGDPDAYVKGINDFPEDEVPPLFVTFLVFHIMVGLGMYFIALTGWGVILLLRKRLDSARYYLRLLVFSTPLGVIGCQVGWMTAEIGRQPWIVYHELRVEDAISRSVSAGEVIFSLVLFGGIYSLLGVLWLYLLRREITGASETPEDQPAGGHA